MIPHVLAVLGQTVPFDAPVQIDSNIAQLFLAAALGLFLGLEREWSQKDAGVRTFSLITVVAAIFTITEQTGLLIIGSVLVVAQGMFLGIRGLLSGNDSLSLTTSMSMLLAYGIGVVVGLGLLLEAVVLTTLSSMLLVLRRELHDFAENLSREEVRSAAEFAIIAFVIYPLLPGDTLGPWNSIHPQTVWLLVIAISGIGFLNYILVKKFAGRGIAFTAFFGGLVNSTAVIAEMVNRAREHTEFNHLVVGAVLLANAAMAIRNAIIVGAFIPESILLVGVPLGAIALSGVLVSLFVSDWTANIDADLTSPFSVRNALTFGGLFLIILVTSAGAETLFGSAGFLATTFFAGFVSSGTSTTTAVTLVSTGQISPELAVAGVVAGTISSIMVKVFFIASVERSLIRPVLVYNLILVGIGVGVAATIVQMMGMLS